MNFLNPIRRFVSLLFIPRKTLVVPLLTHSDPTKSRTGVLGPSRETFLSMKIDQMYHIDTKEELNSVRHAGYKLMGKGASRFVTMKDGFTFWRLK